MTEQIWKFPISPEKISIEMPKYAKILTVQTQNDNPFIWALVNPENPKEVREFEIIGTGHPIETEKDIHLEYINTFQMHNGALVFHLFEKIVKL